MCPKTAHPAEVALGSIFEGVSTDIFAQAYKAKAGIAAPTPLDPGASSEPGQCFATEGCGAASAAALIQAVCYVRDVGRAAAAAKGRRIVPRNVASACAAQGVLTKSFDSQGLSTPYLISVSHAQLPLCFCLEDFLFSAGTQWRRLLHIWRALQCS